MSKVVTMILGGVETRIEVSNGGDGEWHDNNIGSKEQYDLNDEFDKLIQSARYIAEQIRCLSPDEAEISFGIKVGGEGNLLCFAKVSTEAQFNVKMTWKNQVV